MTLDNKDFNNNNNNNLANQMTRMRCHIITMHDSLHQHTVIHENNKQLLDEAEHYIKNYSDRGQCYLPKRS